MTNFDKWKDRRMRRPLKTMAWGLVAVVFAVWFWLRMVGNPLDELALIRNAKTVHGFVIDTWEEAGSGEGGGHEFLNGATYEYILPDGRKLTARTIPSFGRLKEEFGSVEEPIPIEVEYLPDSPEISRIKGDGHATIWEWLFYSALLGSLLLGLFLSVGISLILQGYREARTTLGSIDQVASAGDWRGPDLGQGLR